LIILVFFFLAQFQNLQKKKVEQVQRKALVQELEEKQLKRMKPTPKTAAPRGSFASYGTSEDEVFFDSVRRKTKFIFILIIFLYQDSTYCCSSSTTNSTNS
jgi:hypothetical protein